MGFWDKYPEVKKELQRVEDLISKHVTSRNDLLDRVVSGQFSAGGKRLRPALVLISSRFGKSNRRKVYAIAGAMEILHTATLVHDDVIDCSRLRRGKETVCAAYGTDMALYTGDYLFTRAVSMLSGVLPAEKLNLLARAIKIVCEGEVDQYRDRGNFDVGIISYLKRIGRKTAVLFSAACTLGAYAGKCPVEVTRALQRFGFSFGMAFQIRDDLKDFTSDSLTEGKTVGNDLMEGVITLPVIYAIRYCPKIKDDIEKFFSEKCKEKEAVKLVEVIRQTGGIHKAEEMLEKYIKRGIKALEELPDNRYKVILAELVDGLRL